MTTEMTWNTKRIHYREKSYYIVEESFGINWFHAYDLEWKCWIKTYMFDMPSWAIWHTFVWWLTSERGLILLHLFICYFGHAP